MTEKLHPKLEELAESLKQGAEKIGGKNVVVRFDDPDPDVLVSIDVDFPDEDEICGDQ